MSNEDPAIQAKRALFNKVYSILVEYGDASESEREGFLLNHMDVQSNSEWRFRGNLGFGGKFWVDTYRHEKTFYVTCYREDRTDVFEATIAKIDELLAPLGAEFLKPKQHGCATLPDDDGRPRSITIEPDEVFGVFAALCAMVEDVHAPQDTMTETDWAKASEVYKRCETELNQRKKVTD